MPTRSLTIGDGERTYRRAGNGPPALFVHPFMLNSRFWLDQLSGLADVRTCWAPDLPGFGGSDPLRLDRIDLGEYADDLIGWLDAVGIREPVDAVGLSGSAIVVALACYRAPDRFRSLTLMSAPFRSTMGEAYDRYKAEMARMAVVEDKSVMFRRMTEYVTGSGMSLLAKARYRSMMEDTRLESIVAFMTATRVELPDDLAERLTVPVLLPIGDGDTLIGAEEARALAARMPQGRVAAITGSGRFPPLERPDLLNACLREFWAGTPLSAGGPARS
jgi:pimeloyl-ACP methyl ester carboxylesterase